MLCDFVGMLLFKTNANDIVAYGLLTVLIIGSYVIYISRGRLEQLVLTSRTVKHKLLFVGIAFLYLALAVYLYFITSVHLKQV
jgi:hypothetical protein